MAIKRSGVRKAIRDRILTRDEFICRKCGRGDSLEIHHIQAVMDGGTDDSDNLITLCVPCHREWELAEMGMNIPFERWLSSPPYSMLFTFFMRQDLWTEAISAKELHETILAVHAAARSIRRVSDEGNHETMIEGIKSRSRLRAENGKARARGREGGRPRKLRTAAEVTLAQTLVSDKKRSKKDICETLGISRSTLWRSMREASQQQA